MNKYDAILIEKYLSNQLTGKELTKFEQRLEDEPELLKETFIDKLIQFSISPHPLMKAYNIVETLREDLYENQ